MKKTSYDTNKFYPIFFTVIFIVFILQYPFSFLESFFYDLRVRWDFGISFKDEIVIVTMDEESDEFLGESYPYTYSTHRRFLIKLLKDRPLIINYFVSLQDTENSNDQEDQKNFKFMLDKFVKGGGAFRFGTEMDVWGEIIPPTSLKDLGYSLALINKDSNAFAKDDVSRRAILNTSGENSLHLWTANKYREYLKESKLDSKSISGSYYVREVDATFTLFRYYTSPVVDNGRITKIPYHRVVVGNFPKGFFTNKIVLVGTEYISNPNDYILTPFNSEKFMATKMNLHASIIQSLIQNKTIFQIPRTFSNILSILIAIFLSFTISRLRPTRGLLITVITIISVIILSFIFFSLLGIWLYLTHIIFSIFVVYYIWVPYRAIAEYQTRYKIQEESKLLKKVDNLKQNFISLMSHDLKTPVAKIAGTADLLVQQYQNNDDQKNHLLSIINSTKELNRFITSILDLTKIESSRLNINMVSKDINQIIESIIFGLRFEANAKNCAIIKDFAPLYPIKIDVELVRRVFSNLIENAIKYSGDGSEIQVRTYDDEKWVYIEIKDNGVGIPANDLEHIFDKFYRVRNDASHKIKGSGLGLYLVKYFVELHGGTISAKSEVQMGTTFLVKLFNK